MICARGRSALREYRRHGVTDQDQPSRTCQTVIGRWSTCRRRSEGGRQSHKRCRHQTESAPPRRHAQESHRVARSASRLRNIARSLPSSRRERRPRRELHPHNDGKNPFGKRASLHRPRETMPGASATLSSPPPARRTVGRTSVGMARRQRPFVPLSGTGSAVFRCLSVRPLGRFFGRTRERDADSDVIP